MSEFKIQALRDYVCDLAKSGVSKELILKSLKKSGCGGKEIKEVMNGISVLDTRKPVVEEINMDSLKRDAQKYADKVFYERQKLAKEEERRKVEEIKRTEREDKKG